MIKFYFPRDAEQIKGHFDAQDLAGSLVMLAEENGEGLAACRFIYRNHRVTVHEIVGFVEAVPLQIYDGLCRSVLFHTMEMDCHSVVVKNCPEELCAYFEILGFEKTPRGYECDDYPEVLFSGCPSCGGDHHA